MILTIPTTQKRQVVDLTSVLAEHFRGKSGHLNIVVQHSTAAITTADLDPGTDQDLLDALNGMLPQVQWRHPHNPAHAPDHLLASIVGPQLMIRVKDGSLQLGNYQNIVLLEFDGPRDCAIDISFIDSPNDHELEL